MYVLLTPSQAEESGSTFSDYSKRMSPYRERAIDIYEQRLRGQPWTKIATEFGITPGRAQQIVWEHEEWLAGHNRARVEAGPPPEADALDLPLTRALPSSGETERRRRMQRWWLERYSLEEIREMAGAIASLLDA